MYQTFLHPLFYLWIPLCFVVAQILCEIFLADDVLNALVSENGPHESMQFFVISLAFIFSFINVWHAKKVKQPLLTGWFILAAICCLYVAGEGISWGQHVFEWATPEFWHEVNDQQETNFHNTSSWLDQKPRLMLLVGIIVGGLIIPLLQKYKPSLIPARFAAIYVPQELSFLSFIILILTFAEKTGEAINFPLFTRFSEVQELLMFYFVALYLFALRKREIVPLYK